MNHILIQYVFGAVSYAHSGLKRNIFLSFFKKKTLSQQCIEIELSKVSIGSVKSPNSIPVPKEKDEVYGDFFSSNLFRDIQMTLSPVERRKCNSLPLKYDPCSILLI